MLHLSRNLLTLSESFSAACWSQYSMGGSLAAASARLPRVRMSAEARQSLRQSTCRYIEAATVSPACRASARSCVRVLYCSAGVNDAAGFSCAGTGGTSCGAWAACGSASAAGSGAAGCGASGWATGAWAGASASGAAWAGIAAASSCSGSGLLAAFRPYLLSSGYLFSSRAHFSG